MSEFNPDELRQTPVVANERFDYSDYEVTSLNYIDGNDNQYGCENGHVGAEPALLVDSSSYNPNDGRFVMQGIVVYQCPICKTPVLIDDPA